MSEKRRDSKGRILRTGESQRKDLTYMYRYLDNSKKRQSIYAPSLDILREKEKEINKLLDMGINIAVQKNMTVNDLVDKFLIGKHCLKKQSRKYYEYLASKIKQNQLSNLNISDVKKSDVKDWILALDSNSLSFNTIKKCLYILRASYNMVIEDGYLNKNPCPPKLDVIRNTTKKRKALTRRQQKELLEAASNSAVYKKYYDWIYILLNTGLRISEFLGLTSKDVDLNNKILYVNHQISYNGKLPFSMEETKTESGNRQIPLTNETCKSFKNVIQVTKNKKIACALSGYGNLLFATRAGRPITEQSFNRSLRGLKMRYNETADEPIDMLSPHVFRHTFCTNLISSNIDIKSVQYLMGHSQISTTLDIYTHYCEEHIKEAINCLDNSANTTPNFTPFEQENTKSYRGI